MSKEDTLKLGSEISHLIAQKLDDAKSLSMKEHMLALSYAVQPFLFSFSLYMRKTNGEDPIPDYLEHIKKLYQSTKTQFEWPNVEDKLREFENGFAKGDERALN